MLGERLARAIGRLQGTAQTQPAIARLEPGLVHAERAILQLGPQAYAVQDQRFTLQFRDIYGDGRVQLPHRFERQLDVRDQPAVVELRRHLVISILLQERSEAE